MYGRNNPLKNVDPDGKGILDAIGGAINAFGSDLVGGADRTDSGNSDFKTGQAVGDALATIGGAAEAIFGGGEAIATSPAALTVAGAVVPSAGVGMAVQGGVIAAVGGKHLAAAFSDAVSQSSSGPSRKEGGAKTEPNLPDKTVASGDGITVEHYTRSGDHGPAHLHVEGGGPSTRIGQMGKPLKGDPALSSAQKGVVQSNKGAIRKAVDQIQRYHKYNQQ